MLKKKDPYIDLLDFYYERFPEAVTLKEVLERLHQKGHITNDELEIMKSFGAERHNKKDEKIEISAAKKRHTFEMMFMRAGDTMHSMAGRNAPHVMNSTHYFYRLDYKNIMEAHKSSRIALIISLLAILISILSLGMTWVSDSKPVKISDDQIKQITDAISRKDQ